MAFVAAFGFEMDFRGFEFGVVVGGRIGGAILEDGEVAPASIGGGFLDEEIEVGDGIGEDGDVIEHGSAVDVFLGGDDADIGAGDGVSFVEEALGEEHGGGDFVEGEALGVGSGEWGEGGDGGGPSFANFFDADGIDEAIEVGAGELGEVEGGLEEEAGLGGDDGFEGDGVTG